MSDDEKLYQAYKLAIDGRNFHYENFNKWMNFFYVAVGAIFYAYFNTKVENLKPILAVFGLIVSIYGYLSCKGYYYWIYNWIWQVVRFENEIDLKYKVYATFAKEVKVAKDKMLKPFEPANVSTSKISLLFFLTICIVWSYLIVNPFVKGWNCLSGCNFKWVVSFPLSVALTYLVIIVAYIFRKKIKSSIDDYEIVKCKNEMPPL